MLEDFVGLMFDIWYRVSFICMFIDGKIMEIVGDVGLEGKWRWGSMGSVLDRLGLRLL